MRWPPGNGQGPDSEELAGNEAPAANETMTPDMRLRQLQARHRALDNKILEMQEFPYQNQILLQRLKKEKLRLKDCISQLKDEIIPDIDA